MTKTELQMKPQNLTVLFITFLIQLATATGCANKNVAQDLLEPTQETQPENSMEQKETYVLIHSAWLGGWQWDGVTKILEAAGHRVIAPDLPGHGQDKTAPKEITMDNYIDTVSDILLKETEPVILVGHSFNGITVSRAAELHPTKVKGLVFLAGFLLPNGGSFMSAVQGVKGSTAVENFSLSEDKTFAFVKSDEVQNAFAHDIQKEAFDSALPAMVPEPAAPLFYALEVTDQNFGKIPKFYIECTEDRAVPIEVQRSMYSGNVVRHFSINSSHTPNFSQPEKVASILVEIGDGLQNKQ